MLRVYRKTNAEYKVMKKVEDKLREELTLFGAKFTWLPEDVAKLAANEYATVYITDEGRESNVDVLVENGLLVHIDYDYSYPDCFMSKWLVTDEERELNKNKPAIEAGEWIEFDDDDVEDFRKELRKEYLRFHEEEDEEEDEEDEWLDEDEEDDDDWEDPRDMLRRMQAEEAEARAEGQRLAWERERREWELQKIARDNYWAGFFAGSDRS